MAEEMDDRAVVGHPPISRANHINKRALRNKSLSISFNEKDLRDYVGGFHKRKKKRRKVALQQQEEAGRRKRLEDRKKRRKEKEYALYGGEKPKDDDAKSADEDLQQDEETELNPSVSGTTSYENGDLTVTVTTSEIAPEEEEDEHPNVKPAPLTPVSTGGADKKHNIPVSKKKPFKKGVRGKSRTKLQSKRDRRKGKVTTNKRRH